MLSINLLPKEALQMAKDNFATVLFLSTMIWPFPELFGIVADVGDYTEHSMIQTSIKAFDSPHLNSSKPSHP
jgi:hypothetical protein